MKKWIALLVSVVLLMTVLPCTAEEEPHDAYEWGMLEMFRQYLCRSNIYIFTEDFGGDSGGNEFCGIPEYDCTGFPTGVILDRDHRCVSVKGTSEILHMYLWQDADPDEVLPIMAGYAYFQAWYCSEESEPVAYELSNGEFREVDYEEGLRTWVKAYVNQLDTVSVLAWTSLRNHEDVIDDAIGRLRTLWMGTGGLGMEYGDQLLWESIPDTMVFLDDERAVVMQAQQSTLVITYDNTDIDPDIVKGYALFHLLMAGCEFYEMNVYSGSMNGSTMELAQLDMQTLRNLENAFVECVAW